MRKHWVVLAAPDASSRTHAVHVCYIAAFQLACAEQQLEAALLYGAAVG